MPTVSDNMRQRQFGPTKGYKQPGVDISQTISPPSDWHPNIRQPFTGTPNLGPPIKNPRPASGPPTPFDPMAAAGALLGDFDPKNPKYSPLSPNPANPLNRPPEPAGYTGGASGSWGPPETTPPPPTYPVAAQPLPSTANPPMGPLAGIAGAVGGLGQAIGQNFQGTLPPVGPTGAVQPPGPTPYGAGHPAQQGAALAPPTTKPLYQPPRGLKSALQPGGLPPGPPTAMAPGAYENQLANELGRQNAERAARGPLAPEDPFANPLSSQGHYGAAVAKKGGLLTNEEAGALPRGKNADGSTALPYMPSKTVGGAYGQKGTQGYAKGDPRNIQDMIDKDKSIGRQGNFRESMLADLNGRPSGGKLTPKDNTPGGDPALAEKNLLAKGYKKTASGAFTPENPNSEKLNAARAMLNSPERKQYLADRKSAVANRLGGTTARTIRNERAAKSQTEGFERSLGPQAYTALQGQRAQTKLAGEAGKRQSDIAKGAQDTQRYVADKGVEARKAAADAATVAKGVDPKTGKATDTRDITQKYADSRKVMEDVKNPDEFRAHLDEQGFTKEQQEKLIQEHRIKHKLPYYAPGARENVAKVREQNRTSLADQPPAPASPLAPAAPSPASSPLAPQAAPDSQNFLTRIRKLAGQRGFSVGKFQ